MRSRIVLILIGLTLLWSLMIGRAAYLQILPNARLKALQKRQFEMVVTLNPRRGDVLDRNGHELAVSMVTYSLFVDPKIIEEPRRVIKFLSHELKVPAHQIAEKIHSHKKRFVWVARGIEKNVRDEINDQKIRGLGFIEESKRIYPNEKLLANVLGFVGGEGKGLEGLELRYNDTLEAAKKKVSFHRDARGRPLIVNGQVFNQVPDGSDVVLTIDRELQFILEQELAQTVALHQADSAVGVVLDAQTSEVLAMANAPSFDPNKPEKYGPETKRNRSVTDSFEPGSTMKTFVLAGAIHRGVVQPDTQIDCQGGIMHIGKRVIREADTKHKFQNLSVTQILALSSNVGMTKVAFKMGQDAVRDSFLKFGFGEKLGIDLPGEARGILQPFPWRDHLLANISFGHGLTATPLQIANAYAAIASGGYLHRPYIVNEIRDHEDNETFVTKPKTLSRVLNDEEVMKMKQMLLAVTSKDGTGFAARVPGFPVAGKTGTAQKVNPNGRGYLKGGYISSFAGFIPAGNPKFVIYIAVDHPRKEYYGAAVAAPVFSRVASFAVRRAGLAPVKDSESLDMVAPLAKQDAPPVHADADISDLGSDLAVPTTEYHEASVASSNAAPASGDYPASAGIVAVPGAVSGSTSYSIRDDAPLNVGSGSSGALGLSADPSTIAASASASSFANLSQLSETAIAAGSVLPTPIVAAGDVVPDLTGLTLREVLARVSGTNVQLQVHGHGYVTRSVPATGIKLSSGKLNVYLSDDTQ